jgi:trehalose-phosphatase
VRHLLSCWGSVSARIKQAKHILLLIDYDGTLTPIVERPELANLSPQVRACLQELAENPRLTLGIISGRTLEDLRERVGINSIIYTGNHGLEIEGPGISFVNSTAKEREPLLHSLCEELNKALAGIKGARADDKRLTLSVHYRLVDEAQLDKLNKIFHRIVNGLVTSDKIKITLSKKAYDIRPAVNWDKGKAIKLIAQKFEEGNRPLMIFLGDDVTDYNGFRLVNENAGISVYVGEETTEPVAQYFLYSPKDVYHFLNMMKCILSKIPKLGAFCI